MANVTRKMTKKDCFNALLAIEEVANNENLVLFINHEIELLEKKNSADKKPRCVACSTEGKKEFPLSLQKEMRDFASKTYEKAKRSNPCKLGRNPRKKREVT